MQRTCCPGPSSAGRWRAQRRPSISRSATARPTVLRFSSCSSPDSGSSEQTRRHKSIERGRSSCSGRSAHVCFGALQILGAAGLLEPISPLAAERWFPPHEPLCAPLRSGEFGDEEVGQRANLRRTRARSGCYKIQTPFGQAPIGQNGFELLVQEILCRDKLGELGNGKSSENRGQ